MYLLSLGEGVLGDKTELLGVGDQGPWWEDEITEVEDDIDICPMCPLWRLELILEGGDWGLWVGVLFKSSSDGTEDRATRRWWWVLGDDVIVEFLSQESQWRSKSAAVVCSPLIWRSENK